ncbi:MAG: hypothetical protein EBV14_05520, partial [Actinobacteria bacterium]|nr:hypothetical protein [Actinomycetota bacterium]
MWAAPAVIAFTVRPLPTLTTGNTTPISSASSPRESSSPLPKRPLPPDPQHFTVPFDSSAHVCASPAAIAVTRTPEGKPRETDGKLSPISSGSSPRASISPRPSCPSSFAPQHFTESSSSSAHAQRVTADSSGASTTQADGSSTQIAALARYVDAGGSHTCVVSDDFSLKCFGSSSSGQIGSGGTASLGDAPAEMGNALLPVNLGSGRTVRAVSTGTAHTCVLLDDATIKCFGEGDAGRLGRGSTADVGRTAASMGNALLPINLGTGRTAKAIATGAAHTCALLDDDSVKCWGANDDGQL